MRVSRTIMTIGCSSLLAASAVAVASLPAFADDVIKVNNLGNAADANPGDLRCDVNASKAGLQCTLRAAIQTANADPDKDAIKFSFGGTTVRTIKVPNALPTITEPVVIDGYSAANTRVNRKSAGTNAKLRIQLRGPAGGAFNGLDLAAPSTVKGLVIRSFNDGIFISPGGEGSRLQGNFIGTTANGLGRAPNRGAGIHIDCNAGVKVGGASKAARNIVSANGGAGILLCNDVEKTVVQGNLIGIGADRRKDLGNTGAGILGYGTVGILIGGDGVLARNTIAYNRNTGIALAFDGGSGQYPSGVRILGNSFFRNIGPAIDLDQDGVTPNDGAGDPDDGSNHLQNYPVITSAVNKAIKTLVRGTMLGEASSTYQVRLFVDTYKEREGTRFLKTIVVTTDADGRASWSTKVPKQRVGTRVTATATNVTRIPAETSEFSRSRAVK